MRAVYGSGTPRHWRAFIRAAYVPRPRALAGLRLQLQRVPGSELAVPGAPDGWLLSLSPELRPVPARATCCILFLHGPPPPPRWADSSK